MKKYIYTLLEFKKKKMSIFLISDSINVKT